MAGISELGLILLIYAQGSLELNTLIGEIDSENFVSQI